MRFNALELALGDFGMPLFDRLKSSTSGGGAFRASDLLGSGRRTRRRLVVLIVGESRVRIAATCRQAGRGASNRG